MTDIEKCDKAWCIATAQWLSAQELHSILNQVMRLQHPETLGGRDSQWCQAVSVRVPKEMAEAVFAAAEQVARHRSAEERGADDPQPPKEPSK